jgi:hypothetical protein
MSTLRQRRPRAAFRLDPLARRRTIRFANLDTRPTVTVAGAASFERNHQELLFPSQSPDC